MKKNTTFQIELNAAELIEVRAILDRKLDAVETNDEYEKLTDLAMNFADCSVTEIENVIPGTTDASENRKRHGGAYDRGGADRHYSRAFDPHYYMAASYQSIKVSGEDLTPRQLADYTAGWKGERFTNQVTLI